MSFAAEYAILMSVCGPRFSECSQWIVAGKMECCSLVKELVVEAPLDRTSLVCSLNAHAT